MMRNSREMRYPRKGSRIYSIVLGERPSNGSRILLIRGVSTLACALFLDFFLQVFLLGFFCEFTVDKL